MSKQIMERNLGLLGVTAEHARAQLLGHRTAQPRQLAVGVDGGGTSTRVAILDDQQRVIAQSSSGPSNPLRVGIAKSTSAITEAIDKACGDAGIQRSDIVAAVVGLAGVRRQDIRARVREALEHSLGIDNLELVTDGDIALYGATGGGPGLV